MVNIRCLLSNRHVDTTGCSIKPVIRGVVTDIEDRLANDFGDFHVGRGADFTGDLNLTGRDQRFIGNLGVGVPSDDRIEHRIRNLIADLVRVASGHRFRGKQAQLAVTNSGIGLIHGRSIFCSHTMRVYLLGTHPDRRRSWSVKFYASALASCAIISCATSVLVPLTATSAWPSAKIMVASLSSWPKTLPTPTSLTTNISQPFRSSLRRPYSNGVVVASPVSAAKPMIKRGNGSPSARRSTAVCKTSSVSSNSIVGASRSPSFLIFSAVVLDGRKSATAAAIISASLLGACSKTASSSSRVDSILTTWILGC